MCGIVGFIDFEKKTKLENVNLMTDALEHRGPDGSGYYFKEKENFNLGFGHRRLSILDLSELGTQPMHFNEYMISFNGEVYNYKDIRKELIEFGYTFSSNCDTEVILKAFDKWGTDCVHKFNGMFAIAIFDKKSEALYLFRDRVGIKPLYFSNNGNYFAFASELKALHKLPNFDKSINKEALYLFLYQGYITSPYSIYENVMKLNPGEFLIFRNKNIEKNKYWDLKEKFLQNKNNKIENIDEALNEFDTIIKSAVEYRMISDVPIGCFLSGGYDSSLIASIMQELSPQPIDTFSIGFYEEEFNEANYAKEVSDFLGTKHHELYFSVDEEKNMLSTFSYYFDEPFADASLFPTMMLSKLTKQNVTVGLSGDGGDELFCGYDSYDSMLSYQKYKYIAKTIGLLKPFHIEKLLYKLDHRFLKLPYLDSMSNMINNGYLQSSFYISGLINDFDTYISRKYLDILSQSGNIQEQSMLLDMNTWLPSDILTKVDRASMSVGLEARVPILDHRVIEFSFKLDHSLKYHNGEKKYLLKEYVHRRIPKDLMIRPKKGFAAPNFNWLSNDLKYLLEVYLSKDYLIKQDIFNPRKVIKLLDMFWNNNKEMNVQRMVWNLLIFQLWWERDHNTN